MDEQLDYCRTLLVADDEDLALSLNYARAVDQRRLAALFALQIEIRRIPRAVSEPPLGEIRLQWWREALDEIMAGKTPRAHPVVLALAHSNAVSASMRAGAERLIDGRARLLYETSFSSVEDFEGFVRDAEAPLAAMAFGDDAALDAAMLEELGAAYALARFAPADGSALATEAAARARAIFDPHKAALNRLSAEAAGRVAFLALTHGHAARPDRRPFPVAKRLALFKMMLTGRF